MLKLEAKNLTGLRHGFFGAEGGVSSAPYASLNCGINKSDKRENVLENRQRVMSALGTNNLIILTQMHTAGVVVVKADDVGAEVADAMVTNTSGLCLGILTADCTPILLADKKVGVIGAVHSGWRGTEGNIVANTVSIMRKLGARDIAAALGPALAFESFEVGPEFADKFQFKYLVPHREKPGRYLFKHSEIICDQLRAAGVEHIEQVQIDTFKDTRFFSCRRATQAGDEGFGLQVSAIAL